MDKISKYKIIPELKIIVEYFEGSLYLDDMIEFVTKEMKDKDYSNSGVIRGKKSGDYYQYSGSNSFNWFIYNLYILFSNNK